MATAGHHPAARTAAAVSSATANITFSPIFPERVEDRPDQGSRLYDLAMFEQEQRQGELRRRRGGWTLPIGRVIEGGARLNGGLILGFADLKATRAPHGLDVEAGPKRAEIVVWTDDVDAAFTRLTANGAPPLSPPHDFIGRLRAPWMADPDGGPVQMITELAVPAPST